MLESVHRLTTNFVVNLRRTSLDRYLFILSVVDLCTLSRISIPAQCLHSDLVYYGLSIDTATD